MPVKPKSAKKPTIARRWDHELDVVGLKFRWKRDGRRGLADMIAKRGSVTGMRLVREPDNKVDEFAIMVCLPERILNGTQLGYIRTDSAAVLAPKLDDGSLVVLSAKLEELDADDDWNTGTMLVKFGDVKKPAKRKGSTKPKIRT